MACNPRGKITAVCFGTCRLTPSAYENTLSALRRRRASPTLFFFREQVAKKELPSKENSGGTKAPPYGERFDYNCRAGACSRRPAKKYTRIRVTLSRGRKPVVELPKGAPKAGSNLSEETRPRLKSLPRRRRWRGVAVTDEESELEQNRFLCTLSSKEISSSTASEDPQSSQAHFGEPRAVPLPRWGRQFSRRLAASWG